MVKRFTVEVDIKFFIAIKKRRTMYIDHVIEKHIYSYFLMVFLSAALLKAKVNQHKLGVFLWIPYRTVVNTE
jgi:hypothetical protein